MHLPIDFTWTILIRKSDNRDNITLSKMLYQTMALPIFEKKTLIKKENGEKPR